MKIHRWLPTFAVLLAIFPALASWAQTIPVRYFRNGLPSAMYAPAGTLGFELPVERAGHAFAFKWRTTNAGVVKSGFITVKGFVNTSGAGANAVLKSLLITTPVPPAPFSAVEWWIADTTANQESAHAFTTPSGTTDLRTVAWTTSGLPMRYFAVSNSHLSNLLLAGSTSIGWSMVTPNYTIGTYSAGMSGSLVPMNWFVASAQIGAGDFALADRTQGSKAPLNQANVIAANWTYDFPVTPFAGVTFYLPAAEVNHLYVLHYQVPGQVAAAITLWPQRVATEILAETVNAGIQTIAVGDGRVSALVAIGADFWLTRSIDGATSPILSLTSALASSSTPKVWHYVYSPAQMDWTPVTFGIANRYSGQPFSVWQTSSISPATLTETGLTLEDYTSDSYSHPFGYFTVTALVNPAEQFNLHVPYLTDDLLFSRGEQWVYDGWKKMNGPAPVAGETPTPPPAQFTLTLEIQGPRASSPFFAITVPDGTVPTEWDGLSIGTVELPDLRQNNGATWVTPNATINLSLPNDGSRTPEGNVGFWGVTDPNFAYDPRLLYLSVGSQAWHTESVYWPRPEVNRTFYISLSRWNSDSAPHLWIEQADGWKAPLTGAYTLQGTSILNNEVWTSAYYTFTATAKMRENVPFWIVDEDTGDISPPDTTNLINWFALPKPTGLTGAINTATGVAELQWPLGLAALQGGFEIECKFSDDLYWRVIASLPAESADAANILHLTDASPDPGQYRSYRVRYLYGEGTDRRRSAPSSELRLPGLSDFDGDGIPYDWEMENGLDPNVTNGGDTDTDGLSDLEEYQWGTDPNLSDTDRDGLPDGWEVEHGYDPTLEDADQDFDLDGRTGAAEYSGDPNFDTDEDMLPDWWEQQYAFNPRIPDEDFNGEIDGHDDADEDGRCNVWEYRRGYHPRAADNPVEEGPLLNLRATPSADGGLDITWELGPDPLPVIKLYVQNRITYAWRVYATLPPTATSFHATPDLFLENER